MGIYNLLRRLLRPLIVDSFLSETAPATRAMTTVLMCGVLFVSNPVALGILTACFALIVIGGTDSVADYWPIFLLPIVAAGVVAITAALPSVDGVELVADSIVMIWRLTVVVLAAVVFDVLIPQEDLRHLSRALPWPQVWVAVIAAVRSVEIGGWAVRAVSTASSTRGIRFTRNPLSWADAVATGFTGHFLEFLNGFKVSLRVRGIESSRMIPLDPPPTFGAADAILLALASGLTVLSILVSR